MNLVKPEIVEDAVVVEAEAKVETKPTKEAKAAKAAKIEKEEIVEEVEAVVTDETGEAVVDSVVDLGEAETEATEATEVAVVEASTDVVEAKSNTEMRAVTARQFAEQQAAAGFEGLELGTFSFDRVKLSEGKFLLGNDEDELGESFNFIPLSTRALYTVSQSTDEDSKMFYSYDPKGLTLADGSSAEETLNEWKEEGYGTDEDPLVIKQYIEVMAELIDREDGLEGSMVSLSIPPASRQRFGGMGFQAMRKYNCQLDGVVVTASVGAKAGEGKKSFRPWNFKLNRKL